MEPIEFKRSLSGNTPPEHISTYLRALWFDGRGNWDKAHQIVQDLQDGDAAWIHAYLHRKEGDIPNADYWYGRAGKRRPDSTLDSEWDQIVTALLS
jgi:hypothetical protein